MEERILNIPVTPLQFSRTTVSQYSIKAYLTPSSFARKMLTVIYKGVVQLAAAGHIRPETTCNQAREIVC
jgi:hypothetical protein